MKWENEQQNLIEENEFIISSHELFMRCPLLTLALPFYLSTSEIHILKSSKIDHFIQFHKYNSDNPEFLFIEKNFYNLLESIVLPSSQDTYRFFSGESNPQYFSLFFDYLKLCNCLWKEAALTHPHTCTYWVWSNRKIFELLM